MEAAVTIGPLGMPRILEDLRFATTRCSLGCIELEIGSRHRVTFESHIGDIVHIGNEIHHNLNSQRHLFALVLFAIANNLQRLLNLYKSVVFILRCGLQFAIEIKAVPTLAFEHTTILAMPCQVTCRLCWILADIALQYALCLWVEVLVSNYQHRLIYYPCPCTCRESSNEKCSTQ